MTAHESVVYDVQDFKVQPMTADTGGAPTYAGGLIDVPGIASVSMQANFVTGELKGDSKIIAKKGRIDRFNFSTQYGKLSLDVLNALIGGTVTDPSGAAAWALGGVNSLPYFKAQFRIHDADVADIHITAYKCQLTGGNLVDQSTDNFGQPTADFEAIPCTSDDTLFVKIEFLDVSTPLS